MHICLPPPPALSAHRHTTPAQHPTPSSPTHFAAHAIGQPAVVLQALNGVVPVGGPGRWPAGLLHRDPDCLILNDSAPQALAGGGFSISRSCGLGSLCAWAKGGGRRGGAKGQGRQLSRL